MGWKKQDEPNVRKSFHSLIFGHRAWERRFPVGLPRSQIEGFLEQQTGTTILFHLYISRYVFQRMLQK